MRRLAWVNRFTYVDERGELESEVWLFMLPSWGVMPVSGNFQMVERFCQRWVAWDSVSGECFAGGFPVDELP